MNDEIKNIQDAIEIQNKIMRECQNQIRQAAKILEENERDYKKAMEEKLHLQDKLIEAIKKKV